MPFHLRFLLLTTLAIGAGFFGVCRERVRTAEQANGPRMDDQRTDQTGGGVDVFGSSPRERFLLATYQWLMRAMAVCAIIMGIVRMFVIGDAAACWLIGGGITLLCLQKIFELRSRLRSWISRKAIGGIRILVSKK